MTKTKYIPSKKTFSQIQAQWNSISSLDAKNKIKAMREIGHDILNSYDKRDANIEQLMFYMKILKIIIKIYTFPQKLSKLSVKVTRDWLELSGNVNTTIISTHTSEIISDCPGLYIGDLRYFKEHQNRNLNTFNTLSGRSYTSSYTISSDQSYRLGLINEGKIYELGTGGDAEFYLEFRLIDSPEPALNSNEMKFVVDCTETVIMDIPSGIIIAAHTLDAELNLDLLATTTIPPGTYKMTTFFIFKKRVATFCIVLCKTNEAVKNNYQSIYSFLDIY
jgi:hypothetical protein